MESAEYWRKRLEEAQESPSNPRSHPSAGVSACLLGWACRYDGRSKVDPEMLERYERGELLPLCPETQGGLPIPRPPAGLAGGAGAQVWEGKARVLDRQGADLTRAFQAGAQAVARALQERGIKRVYLKQHSPSCGSGSTGGADGKRRAGDGVACALLRHLGLEIIARG